MPPKDPVPVVADGDNEQYATKEGNTGSTESAAKTSNPARNVGGTAKDGGLSTAATVADGGPDDKKEDPTFKPS